jgi:peptidoglycan/LPS O-acetylase OafA/YrhL
MPKPAATKGPRLAYRPGLDGLRAIAVAAVFLYHSRIDWLPGGFLGVDLFFVLSGYLITSLLLVEWDAGTRIDLRRFWLRRARRLLPALVVVVLAALILGSIFARGDLARTRGDAVSSLLYYTNWHLILANHSYFVRMGNPSLLQHLWSLAVEEQFYVIWPLLLVPGLVLLGRKRLPYAVVAGIAGSTALMWVLYTPTDPSRVYYGTDTRAFLLLMGILLALVWPAIERLRRGLPLLELLGVSALVTSVLLFRQMQDFNPTLYRGGDLAAAFCFAVLIAAVAHPATGIGQALGVAPLRWLGERSYGIYLWHWPVVELMRPGVDIPWTGPGVVVAQAAIVLSAAALSYRYVEQPIRTGSLQRRLARYSRRIRLEVVGGTAMGLVAAFAILFVIPHALDPVAGYVNPPKARATTHHTQTTTEPRPHPADSRNTGHRRRTKQAALPSGRILALGDSVMLGCRRQLKEALHHRVRIDATVGRQIDDTINELQRLRRHHRLPKTIVIQVGNNGPLWYPDLTRLRHALHGIPDVIVVNVRNATSWQDESNHALVGWLHDWPAAHLADWYGSSTNKMLSDGTHPWPQACWNYARVIANTLRST